MPGAVYGKGAGWNRSRAPRLAFSPGGHEQSSVRLCARYRNDDWPLGLRKLRKELGVTCEPTKNRTETLHAALRTLGVHVLAPENRNDPVLARLEVANALLGAAEREVIDAEILAYHTETDPDQVEQLAAAIGTVSDKAAGWPHCPAGVLRWRAVRLHRAFERAAANVSDADLALDVGRAAAALSALLVGYREVTDLMLAGSNRDGDLAELPAQTLAAADVLVSRIATTLRELALA